jgi:hypothetical protein
MRASHFAIPITSETQWGGHVALAITSESKITLLNDISSNPPRRTSVLVNQSIDAADVFGFNNLGVDASLGLWRGLDIYLDNSLLGFRQQFLNYGGGSNFWVATIQGAYSEKSESTNEGSAPLQATAESKVKTSQAGISLGYKFVDIVPYFSYIYEFHDVSTKVQNATGSFGPYLDSGVHQYYSLGMGSVGEGFSYALEYSMIYISWNRSTDSYQNAAGFKLGYAW